MVGEYTIKDSSPTLTNCILWGDTPDEISEDEESALVITYSDVQGGWTGEGNIDEAPLFMDADGRLSAGSSCIDAGDNSALPADTADLDSDGDTTEPIPLDLDGNPRVLGDVVDMGAYESESADTTPPAIHSVSASPDVLWPANHKMVEVTVEVDATDNSGSAPFCYVLGVDGVTSDEPINGPGDGNTEPDWEYTDNPLAVLLRAERAGGGTGRVYTIIVECTDASGNIASGTVDVTVPHDQGKGKAKGEGEGQSQRRRQR